MQNELIDGVTVLSSRVVDLRRGFIVPCVLGFILCFILLLLAISLIVSAVRDGEFIFAVLAVPFLAMVAIIVFALINTRCIKYTEYKVLIEDEATLSEVYENYEIGSVEGLIYTIREKEKKE